MEKAKKKMVHDWESVNFTMTLYRDSGVSILASVDDILMLLEDHIVRTQTMRGSPFIKPFEKEIREWEERMIRIQETIDEWLKVQAQWLYLDPIFSSEDIMQQMPEEGQMFQVVDSHWRGIMKNTVQQPLVRRVLTALQRRSCRVFCAYGWQTVPDRCVVRPREPFKFW